MDLSGRRPVVSALLLILCYAGHSRGAATRPSLLIHNMDIDCKVTSRFAHTVIVAKIENRLDSSHEAVFDVELPKTAFITNFSMTIDGVTTVGTVKKKTEADAQYGRAVSKGENAGLIQSIGRKMENFRISVNVGARAMAIFTLTYEELLKRYQGAYQLQVKVKPKQLVENFQITADIAEPQGISFVNAVAGFMTNELMDTVQIDHSGNRAHVLFKPTLEQQRKCPACSETLLDGDFVIKYDVNRETSAGNIQIVNGYFVHYFAPSIQKRVPKNVVFVIDSSGSMAGHKIKQTYEAFMKILSDLPEDDHFGLLKFSSHVVTWNDSLVAATPDNIQSAKKFVGKMKAEGGTDINLALLSAAQMLKNAQEAKILPEISASSIIFLSDGDPTFGETNIDTIMRNVKRAAEGVATLYSLGFGADLDYSFLEKMSLENGGVARRIYVDSDSALQLQDFYKEVSDPVLLDVTLRYPNLPVTGLTQNSFKYYYQGSEIVVAGHIDSNAIDVLIAEVAAQGVTDPFSVRVETDIKEDVEAKKEQKYIFGDFTERLWAYLTIDQLLTKRISSDGELKENSTEEALRLSLKYNFVTPLTSMVITTSEESAGPKTIVAGKPKEEIKDCYNVSVWLPSTSQQIGYIVTHSCSASECIVKVFFLFLFTPEHVNGFHAMLKLQSYNMEDVADLSRSAPGSLLRIRRTFSHPVSPFARTIARSVMLRKPKPLDCSSSHLLISVAAITEKICLEISEPQDGVINLFHSSDRGITVNGKLSEGESGFEKIGLVHKKKMATLEVTAENITVTKGRDTQVHLWTAAAPGLRVARKEGNRLVVSLEPGLKLVISLAQTLDLLKLQVESKRADSNYTIGLVSHVTSDNDIIVTFGDIIIQGRSLPSQRSCLCDVTSFGVKTASCCVALTVESDELSAGAPHLLHSLFDIPPAINEQN
ncbi:inter-alpha-trypsin inhibitor heavy chain H3-like [Leptodactylus fuscus]|uniref:inter-alpha-trypsin inhibitor heavy chain H3-like n=1 Tax=Leptodactylus fuscus TaxID=238119 RepID=UPI003F4E5C23